ncbi:MAG: glycoside hydrolase family 97 catalytic domain-containing protein [Planctomycetes bacterium]|nr:glycoside hydrolase family 97 catalytic domain-containing protein [Planctomycetota bacterium]
MRTPWSIVGSLLAVAVAQAPTATLASPDGRLQVLVELRAAGTPQWSATFIGVRLRGGFGLELVGGGRPLLGAAVVDQQRTRRDATVPVLFGKAATARDHHEELRLQLRGRDGERIDLVLRCYDDALAFRYEIPAQDGLAELHVQDELTTFAVPADRVAWVQYLEHHKTSHEHEVVDVAVAQLPADRLLDLPLLLTPPAGTAGPFVAITEAALRGWAGMALRRDAAGHMRTALTPREDGSKVRCPLPARSPWRVVWFADRLGALLESHTLWNLNDPPAMATDWIRPGKMTWPWWNGYRFDAEPGEPVLSLSASKRHIDFCADHGIAWHAWIADETDSPWYHQGKNGLFPGPQTDATRVREGLDLPAIQDHARQRGVGLWTWVHHGALRGKIDAVFAALAAHGFGGVMIDFLDHDDQATVEFAEQVLLAAARHRVLVHFHGVWKPTGWQRTFPHLMNHEAALNLEYLKWSDRCTPAHDLRIAFTRLLAGPVDYHLGGFRSVPRAQFRPRHVGPNVLGTRCHQLALYVCFDNPNPMVADRPAAYLGQSGFDFVQSVPTWWDETRVLFAEVSTLLVTARRRGDTWYVGGLAAGAPRRVVVPLTFLGDRPFTARIWADSEACEAEPDRLTISTHDVTAADTLELALATDGGFVVQLDPRSSTGR